MTSKLDQLKSSLETLAGSNEVYSGGGRLVPLPDKNAFEKRIQPIKKGSERGANNLPPIGTSGPDEIEQLIVDAYQEALTDTAERVSETAGTFNARIQSINLLGMAEEVTDGCAVAIEDFRTQVLADKGKLKNKYRDVMDKESDFRIFKADNGLRRSAQLPSKMRSQLGWAVIALIFLIESFVNAGYLSEGNQAGLVGAYAQSFSFSFVNLFIAYVMGMYTVKYCWGSSSSQRLFGIASTVFFSALAACLNLALAHYRDAASMGFSDQLGQIAMQNLLSQPFSFNEIQSLILFLIGCAACMVATIDFFGLDDSFPGYGKVARARRDAFESYESEKQSLINDLDDMRAAEEDNIKGSRTHLSGLQIQVASLAESRKAIFDQWREFKDIAAQQCSELVSAYRQANRAARSKAPASFNKKLAPIAPQLTVYETPIDQSKLQEQVASARTILQSAQGQFYEEFNKALSIFEGLELEADDDKIGDSQEDSPNV